MSMLKYLVAVLLVTFCVPKVTARPSYVDHRSLLLAAAFSNNNRTVTTKPTKPIKLTTQPKCVNGVCEYDPKSSNGGKDVRGGGGDFNPLDGDYDDDEEYYDEYEEEEDYRARRPPPQSRRPDRREPPPRHSSRSPYRSPPAKSGSGALGTAAGLAKKTVDVTTSAAVTSLKTSGKAAFYLVSPKHVKRNEVWGVWRLDQQVGKLPDGPFASCAANVELTPRGDCITKFEEEVYRTPYLFKEKSWPKSCSLEFEARAFQGPKDKKPVLMLYKGYFRRKIADRHVVKIVGKIYELRKQRFGRGAKRVQVGTFVARRRISAPPGGVRLQEQRKSESGDQDEYDDEGYDEDEYDLDGYEEDEYDEYDK